MFVAYNQQVSNIVEYSLQQRTGKHKQKKQVM